MVCEGATPVREVHEEDVTEEDVCEVRKVVREVPHNVDIRVTAATVSPIEGGYHLQIWGLVPFRSLTCLLVRQFSINTSPSAYCFSCLLSFMMNTTHKHCTIKLL